MATSNTNNWGGMGKSTAKLTTPKVSLPKATVTKPKATPKSASTPNPMVPGGFSALSYTNPLTGTTQTSTSAQIKATQATQAAKAAAEALRLWGIKPSTPSATAGLMASNYGTGAGGSVIGKGTVTPADIAKIIKSPSGAAGGAKPAPSKSLTDLLRVPGLESIYNPVLDQLQAQSDAASKRYEANAANLTNIFGALSGLAAQDKLKIQEQYAQSLAAASGALQQRTTAANEASAAGVAQAEATGAERGMGPGMAVNPIQTATAEGNAQATEYQTTWDNLQRANEAQAIESTKARGAGYDQQRIAAITGLQQSLEDRLMQIGGNTAQVQSDIAKAKFGQETNIAQAKYAEAIAARNAAAQAAASAANAIDKTPAIDKIRQSLGPRFDGLMNGLTNAYAEAYTRQNPTGSTKVTKPNASDVMAIWVGQGGGTDVLNEANTVARLLYNK